MSKLTKERFERLRDEVEEAKSAADKAQGAYEQLLTRLEEEFDCKDLKQAKTKLKQMEAEEDKAEAALTAAMDEYESKWKQE